MKTPRTDAERRALKKAKSYPPDPVSADFARQLETELQAMTALADKMAETLKDCKNRAQDKSIETHPDEHTKGCIDDIWEWTEEALADYENHKKPDQPAKKPCDCIEKCGKYWIQRCDCQNGTSLAAAQSWCDSENHKKESTP